MEKNFIFLGFKGRRGREVKAYYEDAIINDVNEYLTSKTNARLLKNVGIKILNEKEILLFREDGSNIVILRLPASYKEIVSIKESNFKPIVEFDLYNSIDGKAGIGAGAIYSIKKDDFEFNATIKIIGRDNKVLIKGVSLIK
jgi:hypothetical protein